jgi:hypothetical protein
MTMESDRKGHGNPWAQIGLLAAVTVVLIVLASHYVW